MGEPGEAAGRRRRPPTRPPRLHLSRRAGSAVSAPLMGLRAAPSPGEEEKEEEKEASRWRR